MKSDSQQQLITRLLAKDEHAFHQLVGEFHPILRRIATAIVGDANAEEVVQDAWVNAIRALASFQGKSSLKTWLTRIVINCAKSRLRYESYRSACGAELAVVDDAFAEQFDRSGHRINAVSPWHSETPDALLSSEQLMSHIQQAVAALPQMQQAVLLMHDFEVMAMGDICNILDIEASNGRVLLHRARLAVKQAIDDYM